MSTDININIAREWEGRSGVRIRCPRGVNRGHTRP
jgi:hypothetical protein